ncbi:hypothetical protein OOT55_02075 [Marinimicrobium sp. C6131]|uniref:hypothetical protein n=1 Tax=Marinimicrobium sp. C6131 TaxID=3022676 RepID=UPI00223C951E|nr:hypothetical protein [Marinimicrobium sp. C6131]UZJ44862.1 hypothetical protein OOT55_02075 [Marinimicrobium sp. C6131]
MSETKVMHELGHTATGRAPCRWRMLGGMTGLALLLGCSSPAPTPTAPQPSPAAVEAAPEPILTREERLERWLDEGDRALSADRLLSPLGDNAHDRYRAVLIYEPENTRAISGLQAIALRYLDLARSAAARSAFSQALGYLDLAASVDPGNPLVADFRGDIQRQQERLHSASPLTQDGQVVQLNGELLRQRADRLVGELHELARRVRDGGDFVLIVARTDAEGRWVYQQMRDGVPGYLLRGDIKLGSPPRIELLPPLE